MITSASGLGATLFQQLFELLERSRTVVDGLSQATRNLAKATPDRSLRAELERANKVAVDHVRSLGEILQRAKGEFDAEATTVLGSVREFQITEQAFKDAQKQLRIQEQNARRERKALQDKFERAQTALLFYGEHPYYCAVPEHASKVHQACTCGFSDALLGEQKLPHEVEALRGVALKHLEFGEARRALLKAAADPQLAQALKSDDPKQD